MQRLIGSALLIASLSLGWFWMDYRDSLDMPMNNAEMVLFEIEKGESLAEISEKLHEKGLLQSPLWFRLMTYIERSSGKIKYGEYGIKPHMTPRQLLELFVSGKVYQHSLTFIEGWRFQQLLEAIQAEPALIHHKDADIIKAIGIAYDLPEGLFYPDTYFYTKGTTDVELLKRAYKKMQITLEKEWQGRAEGLPLENAYQALILASIVEKETAKTEERSMVSGVFIRRLQKHMKLQTDPTVIYGMGDDYHGDIRREDLTKDTAYNTYVHPGLPPTPIGMPGIGSIHATLHPDDSENLYFVAKGDGSHYFSEDLNEHTLAVQRFQLSRHAASDTLGAQAGAWAPDACARRLPHPGPLPKGEGDLGCSLRDLHGKQ